MEELLNVKDIEQRHAEEHGPDHPLTLAARHNLAVALMRTNALPDALDMHRQVAVAQCLVPTPALRPALVHLQTSRLLQIYSHPPLLVASRCSHRGCRLMALHTPQVRAHATTPPHTVHAFSCALSCTHQRTTALETVYELALCCQSLGFQSPPGDHRATLLLEAEDLFRQVKQAFGPSHHDEKPSLKALCARTSLASLLRRSSAGRLAEAEELLRVSLTTLRSAQGPLHPETLVATNQLGQLLHEKGRLMEALPLLRETLAGRLAVLGSQHPQTFNSRTALSRLLTDMGRPGEALSVLRPEDVAKASETFGAGCTRHAPIACPPSFRSHPSPSMSSSGPTPPPHRSHPAPPPPPHRHRISSRASQALDETLDEIANAYDECRNHHGGSMWRAAGHALAPRSDFSMSGKVASSGWNAVLELAVGTSKDVPAGAMGAPIARKSLFKQSLSVFKEKLDDLQTASRPRAGDRVRSRLAEMTTLLQAAGSAAEAQAQGQSHAQTQGEGRRLGTTGYDGGVAPLPERIARLKVAASKLREPGYTVRLFHADMCFAFPELGLYLDDAHMAAFAMSPEDLVGGGPSRVDVQHQMGSATTGGTTMLVEYNRTVGALFCLYWLCRLRLPSVPGSETLDGQAGFCFGVDEEWQPNPDATAMMSTAWGTEVEVQASKRSMFCDTIDWGQLHQLMIDAGLLIAAKDGSASVAVERTVAMLALTAVHDVMKVSGLLPTVLAAHAPYLGYQTGDTIEDHDIALGYVLEHDADALPCYAALVPHQQRPIKFTQAKLGFNHGWLVQAEAPPGALFNSFKALLDAGGLDSSDVAFYFVHWLTDLAGADPTPLRGSEKFAAKFPSSVLASFVRSFPLVQSLANIDQTALMEQFLHAWWPKEFGEPPRGPLAIAKMRLVVQAQAPLAQAAICHALEELPQPDLDLLAFEMALTGVSSQEYATSPASGGPAFLVYYSPAFIRLFVEDMRSSLRVLAEVYRAARKAYPLVNDGPQVDTCVTVRVDQLKALATLDEVPAVYDEGYCWVLVGKSERDAVVERQPLSALPSLLKSPHVAVMSLWRMHLFKRGGAISSVAPQP